MSMMVSSVLIQKDWDKSIILPRDDIHSIVRTLL